MLHKILYLGLDPPEGVHHYPVIRTEKIMSSELSLALLLWSQFSHVVFTSKTTVQYWFEQRPHFDKQAIAIGDSTAKELEKRAVFPQIAPFATQEGIIALIETLSISYLFIPRSKKARPELTNFLKQKQIPYFALDLYDTLFQKPEPVPDLSQFNEIVFTSPSTVDGFLQIFGALPEKMILTAIGPITARALETVKRKEIKDTLF